MKRRVLKETTQEGPHVFDTAAHTHTNPPDGSTGQEESLTYTIASLKLHTGFICNDKKVKVAHTRLPSVGFRS